MFKALKHQKMNVLWLEVSKSKQIIFTIGVVHCRPGPTHEAKERIEKFYVDIGKDLKLFKEKAPCLIVGDYKHA